MLGNIFLILDMINLSRMFEDLHDFILVKPLITESPIRECFGIRVPELEKLLVDHSSDKAAKGIIPSPHWHAILLDISLFLHKLQREFAPVFRSVAIVNGRIFVCWFENVFFVEFKGFVLDRLIVDGKHLINQETSIALAVNKKHKMIGVIAIIAVILFFAILILPSYLWFFLPECAWGPGDAFTADIASLAIRFCSFFIEIGTSELCVHFRIFHTDFIAFESVECIRHQCACRTVLLLDVCLVCVCNNLIYYNIPNSSNIFR